MTIKEITKAVYENKPDKLKNLLYAASHNLSRATEMTVQRGNALFNHNEPIGIP